MMIGPICLRLSLEPTEQRHGSREKSHDLIDFRNGDCAARQIIRAFRIGTANHCAATESVISVEKREAIVRSGQVFLENEVYAYVALRERCTRKRDTADNRIDLVAGNDALRNVPWDNGFGLIGIGLPLLDRRVLFRSFHGRHRDNFIEISGKRTIRPTSAHETLGASGNPSVSEPPVINP
jgi:hypothetical protein